MNDLNRKQDLSAANIKEMALLKKAIKKLEKDLEQAKSLYRPPGYLRILTELRKLPGGKKWSLILAGQGEASATSHTEELVGYFYKADIINPQASPYCNSKSRLRKSFACVTAMDRADLKEDKSHIFARRPFLGEFVSGNFSFTLLTSHIIYDSPLDSSRMRNILRDSFGVSSYEGLGVGMRKDNYARFAEVKVTLDFIKGFLQKYGITKDLIYMGDFNIESKNKFWPQVLIKVRVLGRASLFHTSRGRRR